MTKQRKSRFLKNIAVQVAGGVSIQDAAKNAGCAESTAYNVSATDEFKQLVSELRTTATDTAVGKLSKAASHAVETLNEIATDKEQVPTARVAAAKTILATLGPVAELHELRGRLDALEAAQKAAQ